MEEEYEYFIATRDKKGEFLVYCSDNFKLSEIDLINLIKICIIEERSKMIGRKILAVYRDSTSSRGELTNDRLSKIGIQKEEKPIKSKKPKQM
jgi:hypothetical protein